LGFDGDDEELDDVVVVVVDNYVGNFVWKKIVFEVENYCYYCDDETVDSVDVNRVVRDEFHVAAVGMDDYFEGLY
jgi:hypothetical protein